MVPILNLLASQSEVASSQTNSCLILLSVYGLLTSLPSLLPFYYLNRDSLILPTVSDEALCQMTSESLNKLHLEVNLSLSMWLCHLSKFVKQDLALRN